MICHLTVLNPAVHPRIYFKLALSQVALGYRVTVIGQDGHRTPYERRGVKIVPVAPFGRLSWRRLWAGLRLMRLALKERPDWVFLHSPELLGIGLLLKGIWRKKVIYDVHEDYPANVLAGTHYPSWLRKPLAWMTRRLEQFAAKRLDGVSYAEKCYENMLGVPAGRYVVLRNTFTPRAWEEKATIAIPPDPYMLYTGTIAREWGILETLSLWEQLNQRQPLHLVIAGFSQDEALWDEIRQRVASSGMAQRCHLMGGRHFVPYADILHLIAHCWFGTALYHPLPHLRGKIPTKFYEFQAMDKPLVFTPTPEWVEWNAQYPLGIAAQAGENAEVFFSRLEEWGKKHLKAPPSSYLWEADADLMARWLEATGLPLTNESRRKPR